MFFALSMYAGTCCGNPTFIGCGGTQPTVSYGCTGNFKTNGECYLIWQSPCNTNPDVYVGDSVTISVITSTNCAFQVGFVPFCSINDASDSLSFAAVNDGLVQGKRTDITYTVMPWQQSYPYLRINCSVCCGTGTFTSNDCAKGYAATLVDSFMPNDVHVWTIPPSIYSVSVSPSSGNATISTPIEVTMLSSVQNLTVVSCLVNSFDVSSTFTTTSDYSFYVTYVPAAWDPDFAAGNLSVNCIFQSSLMTETFWVNKTTDGNTLAGYFEIPIIYNATISPSTGWAKVGSVVDIFVATTASFYHVPTCLVNGIVQLNESWTVLPGNVYRFQYTVQEGDPDVALPGNTTLFCVLADAVGYTANVTQLVANNLTIDAHTPVVTASPTPSSGQVTVSQTVNISLLSTTGEISLHVQSCFVNGQNVTNSFAFVVGSASTYQVQYVIGASDSVWAAGALSINCQIADRAGNLATVAAMSPNTLSGGIFCSAGYQTTGFFQCSICGPGSFSPAPNSPSCTLCLAGSSSPSSGVSYCPQCLPGSFQNASGQTFCYNCSAGFYSSATGATSSSTCLSCPSGTFQPQNGSSACLPCLAGSWSAATAVTCTPCPAGTYSTVQGAKNSSICWPCLSGTFSSAPGSALCPQCPKGQWQNTTGMSFCYNCSAGTAGVISGAWDPAIHCQPCPCGTVAPAGSASCSSCPAGSAALTGSGVCSACDASLGAIQNKTNIVNGHFNDGLTGWTGTGVYLDSVNGHAAFGSHNSQCLGVSSGGYAFQRVNFSGSSSNFTIAVKAWSMIGNSLLSPNTSSGNWSVAVIAGLSSGSNMSTLFSAFDPTWSGWQYRAVYVNSMNPANPIVWVDVYLSYGSSRGGSALFDDLDVDVVEYSMCQCPSGYFFFGHAYPSEPCQPCPTGFSCCGGEMASCPYYNMSFGLQSQCQACLSGWVCAEGVGQPCNKVITSTATYAVNNTCVTCPMGSSCRDGKKYQCDAGSAASVGSTTCSICEPGSFASTAGAVSCSSCGSQTSQYGGFGCYVLP